MQPSTRPRTSSSASGIEHDERVLDAPVGRVGHVRHARQAVERDVVAVGVAREHAARAPAQVGRRAERRGEAVDRFVGRGHEARDLVVALASARPVALLPALVDLVQPVAQRVDQQPLPLRIVEQVVLQVGIAVDDPDVAQHLEQHARRTAGAPLAAQLLQQLPHVRPEQADHENPARAPAQVGCRIERRGKAVDRIAGRRHEARDLLVALAVRPVPC